MLSNGNSHFIEGHLLVEAIWHLTSGLISWDQVLTSQMQRKFV